jgi:hypothetical protein
LSVNSSAPETASANTPPLGASEGVDGNNCSVGDGTNVNQMHLSHKQPGLTSVATTDGVVTGEFGAQSMHAVSASGCQHQLPDQQRSQQLYSTVHFHQQPPLPPSSQVQQQELQQQQQHIHASLSHPNEQLQEHVVQFGKGETRRIPVESTPLPLTSSSSSSSFATLEVATAEVEAAGNMLSMAALVVANADRNVTAHLNTEVVVSRGMDKISDVASG